MQTAMLSLFMACCAQVDERPALLAPDRVRLNATDFDEDGVSRRIDLMFPRNAMAQGRLHINDAIVEAENFDRWIFDDDRPAAVAEKLHGKLDRWIEAADREDRLSRSEKARLRLAGTGDIKRFQERVEQRRQEFETQRKSFKEGCAALRRLLPLNRSYKEGPFGDGSFFAKTLTKIHRERPTLASGFVD